MKEYAGPNTLLKAFQIIRQALKNNAPSAGDGIEITQTEAGTDIGVTTPVRSIVTQEAFDALPEAQRNSGLYVISDGGDGGDSGGGSAEEVYSTEERRIGTWIDGKPLYRKTFSATTPPGEYGLIADISDLGIDTITQFYGCIHSLTNYPLSCHLSTNDWVMITVDTGSVLQQCGSTSTFKNRAIIISIEYTKTTDGGGAV